MAIIDTLPGQILLLELELRLSLSFDLEHKCGIAYLSRSLMRLTRSSTLPNAQDERQPSPSVSRKNEILIDILSEMRWKATKRAPKFYRATPSSATQYKLLTYILTHLNLPSAYSRQMRTFRATLKSRRSTTSERFHV